MGMFDFFRPAHQTADDSNNRADASELDATRLIEEGNALQKKGLIEEAGQRYLEAVRIAPTLARAHLNHGNILLLKGDLQGALDAFRTAIRHKPDYAGAYYNMGNALLGSGQHGEAVSSYRRALEINPDYAEAYSNLGMTLQSLGQNEDAAESYQRALELKPGLAVTHNNLGNALRDLGRIKGAEESYRRALELNPDFAEAYNNLGVSLKEQGKFSEAEASYRRAVELKPDLTDAQSNLLLSLNYTPSQSSSYSLDQARRYGRIVAQKAGTRFSAWQCTERPERLRVGLVSGDLCNHPVGHFVEGLLEHIDLARIELIAYPTHPAEDELTARIRPYFSAWKPLFGRSDETAARLIHADSVHVLLDLSGHTGHNRLPVFAWKSAPVQASWPGYFATTGVEEMDYFLADKEGVPEAQRQQFTETVWYLPDTRLCFTAPGIDLPVAPLPALANGAITFGCFQNLSKVNEGVLTAWAEIFAELPDAKLRMQCQQLGEPAQVEKLIQRLQHHGIAPARLVTHGAAQREAYLAAHAEVDLILDTFPFPGGTTTCEALWMGVPTLTLAGNSLLARQGASLLKAAGLDEWIAESREEYIAKAVTLANDKPKLAALRAVLRQQVVVSPLFDARRFARNFEEALWRMWRNYQARPRKAT